ncbi:MAG: HK97 gp10 family phage protein [Selenomonadaceae bacterium]|nr:HK97 gp10 family phage protein [Selenomonadaceae bacterium]MBR1728440.1 HK97 gp10 family phage protein [Selenomonadaceae bacterium]
MSAELKFVNLDDFINRLLEVGREYPDLSQKYLRRIGNTLKRKAIAASPIGKAPNTVFNWKTRRQKTNRKKLKQSWTGKIVGSTALDSEYQLRTRAPHFHLVERGHVLIFKGKIKGFVQGKYFFKRVVQTFEHSGEVRQELEKFMNEVKAKIEK